MGGKSSDPNKAAMKAQRAQMRRLDKLTPPELEEYRLIAPELVGLLEAEQLEGTDLENISLDPKLRQKQLDTMAQIEQESEEGMSATDRMQMEEMLGGVAAQEKSQRAAIEQEMARRGMEGSGAALAAKLQGTQGGANAARRQAMQMLAQSGDRRRQARREGAGMASQMEGTDYQRQAQLAQARDAINRSNAMNRQGVNQTNLAARQNMANQQANVQNMNSQVANQIAQQNFQNQMSKATGQGATANAMSQIAANTPARPSAFQSALGGAATGASIGSAVPGIGTGIGAAVGAGAGLLGAMEDGGIAGMQGGVPVNQKALEAHQKQEANFKKQYMKKIHSELLGNDNPNGTHIKAEDGVVVDPYMSAQEKSKLEGVYRKGDFDNNAEVQRILSTPEKTEMRQAQGDSQAQGSNALVKSLGALDSILGDKPQQKRQLNLGGYDMEQPENIMDPMGSMDFGNPYAQAAEDGALIESMEESGELRDIGTDFASPDDRASATYAILSDAMNRMKPEQEVPMLPEEELMMKMQAMQQPVPQMEDGGTYQAQDGSLMFTSDGSGDIVEGDSFERDRVDAKLNSGEMVLNAAQQQRLMDMIRGKVSPEQVPDEDIVEGVPSDYQEDLLEGETSNDDTQARGFKNLLEMLGKK